MILVELDISFMRVEDRHADSQLEAIPFALIGMTTIFFSVHILNSAACLHSKWLKLCLKRVPKIQARIETSWIMANSMIWPTAVSDHQSLRTNRYQFARLIAFSQTSMHFEYNFRVELDPTFEVIYQMRTRALTAFLHFFMLTVVAYGQPSYEIVALSQTGQGVSGGQAISPSGMFAAGFSDDDPFRWDADGTIAPLPDVAGRPFSDPQSINDSGLMVGIGATTFFGSNALPVIWGIDSASALQLPAGEAIGRAYGINNENLIVGSVNGGSAERAAVFSNSDEGSVITATFPNGGLLTTAFGVNDAGRIVGQGTDPTNAAVTKGFYLDPGDTVANDIGALTSIGHNSAIAFAVSQNGFITGSSSLNSGAGAQAFIWDQTSGMIAIDFPAGASTSSGRGVNDDGWVVGNAGGVTSLPFLYDGKNTYLLDDLISAGGDGWSLIDGTSNAAFGIANDGSIVGRGLLNGQITGFVMIRIDLLLGDVNLDDEVNLLDVAPFVELLSSGGFQDEADINQDGQVNLLDVNPFVELLAGG